MTSYDDWSKAAIDFAKAKAPPQAEDMPGLNGNDLTATKDILDAVQALSLALTDNRALIAALFTDNERLRAKAGEVAKLNKLVAMQRAAIDAQNEQDGYSLASITRQAENAISHCRRGNNTLAEYQLAKMLGDITGNYRGWEE